MEYYKNLYLSSSIKKPEEYIKKLKKKKITASFFVITLANGPDQLEIHPASCLAQSYFHQRTLVVVGLAQTHEEAVELIIQIVEESLSKRGDCNLKEYLNSKRG